MSISAQLQAIAKFVFPSGVPHKFYNKNTLMGDCKKNQSDTGQDIRFSVATSQGSSGSAAYATASANAGNVQYTRFTVTPVTDYSLARMNGEDWERLSSDEGAVIDAWKDRIDAAVYEARRSLAIHMYRNGTGSRGQISAGSNVATNTITLSDGALGSADIANFYVGIVLQASQNDGGALRNAGATETVAALDRAAGTLTSTSAAWNTVIAAIAASDFLYRAGDAQNGGTAVVITGLGSWLVGGASPGTLFSANRNVDPVALAGTALDSTGIPLEEAPLELAARIGIQGDGKKALYCHPRDKVQLVKLLEAKARFTRPAQGGKAEVGFDGIEFETDNGPMMLKGDINVARRAAFILEPDQCVLNSVGKAPKILEKDGQSVRARDAFDAYEMRIGTYGSFCVRDPGSMGRLSNWGA